VKGFAAKIGAWAQFIFNAVIWLCRYAPFVWNIVHLSPLFFAAFITLTSNFRGHRLDMDSAPSAGMVLYTFLR